MAVSITIPANAPKEIREIVEAIKELRRAVLPETTNQYPRDYHNDKVNSIKHMKLGVDDYRIMMRTEDGWIQTLKGAVGIGNEIVLNSANFEKHGKPVVEGWMPEIVGDLAVISDLEAKIFTDSSGKVIKPPSTSGSGLYIGSTHLGYFNGSAWKTYMSDTGGFFLTGSGSNYLSWNGATLQINGQVTVTNPSDFNLNANRTFRQASAPTAEKTGDLWIDTDDGNKPYTWSGSAWVQAYTSIDGGHISTGTINAARISLTMDNIGDGATYGRVLSTDIQAGHIKLSECFGSLDDIDNGTYGKVLSTDISAGHILLTSVTGTLDDVDDGTTHAKVLATDISAGHIKILGADGTTTVIDGGKIQATSIKAGDIAADAITADKILANAITTAKINAGAVTAGKINVVNLAAINADMGTITAGSISAGLITSGTLSADRIAATSITADKLNVSSLSAISANLGTITAGNIDAGIITSGTLAAARIGAGSITAAKISTGTITANEIASGTITGDKIAAGAITVEKIAVGAANKIHRGAAAPVSAGAGDMWIDTDDGDKPYTYNGSSWVAAYTSIDGGNIITGTITANKIAANTITANEIATNAITANELAAGAVVTNKLDAYAITADKIDTDAVTADKIAANAITAVKIAAGTITTDKLSAGTLTGFTIQTASANQRVVVSGSSNTIEFYKSDGTSVGTIYGGTTTGIGDGVAVSSRLAVNGDIVMSGSGTIYGLVLPVAALSPISYGSSYGWKSGDCFDAVFGYKYNGTQVVTSRKTGWAAASGTPTRTTFATGSVTLPQLAERVKALIDDLISHGLIGS